MVARDLLVPEAREQYYRASLGIADLGETTIVFGHAPEADEPPGRPAHPREEPSPLTRKRRRKTADPPGSGIVYSSALELAVTRTRLLSPIVRALK